MSENKNLNPSRLPLMCLYRFILTGAGSQFVVIYILLSLSKTKKKKQQKPKIYSKFVIVLSYLKSVEKWKPRKCYDTRTAQDKFPNIAG